MWDSLTFLSVPLALPRQSVRTNARAYADAISKFSRLGYATINDKFTHNINSDSANRFYANGWKMIFFSGFVVSFPNKIAHDDPDFYVALDCSKGTHPKCQVELGRAVE